MKKTVAAGELDAPYQVVFGDVSKIVDAARDSATRSVNAAMTAAYWLIGHRIVEFEQSGEERARYGTALMERLAADLTQRFGRGFSRQNIQYMRLFYVSYSEALTALPHTGQSHIATSTVWADVGRRHWQHSTLGWTPAMLTTRSSTTALLESARPLLCHAESPLHFRRRGGTPFRRPSKGDCRFEGSPGNCIYIVPLPRST